MKKNRKNKNSGQVMMIVVMVLSAVMIGATGIAGILTARQTRQTADAGNFSKVLFAADSGFEWGKHRFFKDRSIKDGFTCEYIMSANNDCSPEQASCEQRPSFSSINIELDVTCEPMIEVGNKTCKDGYNCWTITSSAASKSASYVFSMDIAG